MLAPTSSRWRSARASAFVLVAAQIAIGGHILAGGSTPDLTLLAAMSGLLVACLSGLGKQRRTFTELLLSMAATQVVFHLILTLGSHPPATDLHPAAMWVFHAVAALVSTGLLAYGERLLFVIAGWWHRLLPATSPILTIASSATRLPARQAADTTRRDRLFRDDVARRGPPGSPAFAH